MNTQKSVIASLIFLVSICAGNAAGAAGWVYGGVSAGVGVLDGDDIDAFDNQPGAESETTGYGLRGVFGYRINENFAVEGSFEYLTGYEFGINAGGVESEDDEGDIGEAEIDASVIAIDALFGIPVEKDFFVFAKAGYGYWHSSAQISPGGVTAAGSDDGFDFRLGAGVEYRKRFRAEWTRQWFQGDTHIDSFWLTLMLLGHPPE